MKYLSMLPMTVLTAALLMFFVAPVVAEETKPNVIFILADDLGGVDLSCYGNAYYETPNLDRMAKQGMRFTDAYAASSVCSSSRYSIQTGKYPARGDLTATTGGRSRSDSRRYRMIPPKVKHMSSEEVTLAETLQKAGYATASIGKWHIGGKPEDHGYQFNHAGGGPGAPIGGYFLPNRMAIDPMPQEGYLTDHLTDRALEYIEEKQDEPFFLYQSYHSVHGPHQGKPELVQYYKEKFAKKGVRLNSHYAAMVHSLDENVGRILDKLDALKLTEKTVVFFFSDNGGFANNAPLREGKGHCYEGGHREPCLVQYPPIVKPGSVCSEPIVGTDFYPTILELAGLPLMPELHIDGVSIVPLLKSPKASLDREAIYWHFPHYGPHDGRPSGAIRRGDMKLLDFFEDGRLELYNLKDDLSEANDLAKDNPEMVKELHGMLKAWRKEVDAKMPQINPNFEQQHLK